jgi:8-oxo-dGTP pyrophosphatase MutT (NUDIX family)
MEPEDIFQIGVKILITNRAGHILLLRRNLTPAFWDLPGGRMQRAESVLDTAARELFEETGIHLNDTPLHFVGSHLSGIRIRYGAADAGLVFFVYKCDLDASITLSSEHRDFWWASREEAASEMQATIPASFILMH